MLDFHPARDARSRITRPRIVSGEPYFLGRQLISCVGRRDCSGPRDAHWYLARQASRWNLRGSAGYQLPQRAVHPPAGSGTITSVSKELTVKQACLLALVGASCERAPIATLRKHAPVKEDPTKVKRSTKDGPAKYCLHEPQLHSLELDTIRSYDKTRGLLPMKTEYLRKVDALLGWDEGKDAMWSYVECTANGPKRQFHGRPMNDQNAQRFG